MPKIPSPIYLSPAELEARVRQRMDDAMLLSPTTAKHREIMKEIARLRLYAETKRWFEMPSNASQKASRKIP